MDRETTPTGPRVVSFASPAEDIIRYWLSDCERNHSECRVTEDVPPLPTRVLDVGRASTQEPPFLYISNGQHDRYATLSYCWGTLPISTKTTTHTISEYRRQIPLQDLPDTLKDAISLTRSMGIQYLWIDSLCILQDSLEDWEIESASMASVYRLSVVTIVASTARHAYEGCSPSQNKLTLAPCPVSTEGISLSIENRGRHVLYEKPLDQRGWTFQECQLGPRLLYCDGEQLSWECLTSARTEAMPTDSTRPDTKGSYYLRMPISIDNFGFRTGRTPTAKFTLWYRMVERYSGRALTYPDDKLPGIAGLARNFQNMFQKLPQNPLNYLAGLWEQDLLWALLWRTLQSTNPAIYRSPSWSWTSLDSDVAHEGMTLRASEFFVEVLEVFVFVPGLNPFGKVASGKVTLLGTVAPLPSIIFEQETYAEQPGTYRTRSTCWMYPVIQWDRQIPPSIDSVCLRMSLEHGLILTPVKKPLCSGLYTRVGFMQSTRYLKRPKTDPNLLDELEWRPAVVTIM